jgi:DnaJ-class molecular chaperone
MVVEVPKSLNKKQKEALLAFAEACGENKKKGKKAK